jgi:hypothetical protein
MVAEFPFAVPIEGGAGLIVIDADDPNEDGVSAFAAFRAQGGEEPPHPVTLTAGAFTTPPPDKTQWLSNNDGRTRTATTRLGACPSVHFIRPL